MEPLKNLRILVSLSNPKGINLFLRQLEKIFPTEIIATPGTRKHLIKAGFKVTPVEKITGEKSLFDGRIKMIHLPIFAAILTDQHNPDHLKQLNRLKVKPFNLVVINLYPFEKIVKKEKNNLAKIIENIDIGGPAAIRAAAKNFQSVIPVCRPEDYPRVIGFLKKQGNLTFNQRKGLAKKVFNLTKQHDDKIISFLASLK